LLITVFWIIFEIISEIHIGTKKISTDAKAEITLCCGLRRHQLEKDLGSQVSVEGAAEGCIVKEPAAACMAAAAGMAAAISMARWLVDTMAACLAVPGRRCLGRPRSLGLGGLGGGVSRKTVIRKAKRVKC